KITQFTRYGTLLICVVQSAGISLLLESLRSPVSNAPIVPYPGIGFKLMTVLTLTTGTVFIMWLGEQISERGIGNGISLIIFAGIVVDFPRAALSLITGLRTGDQTPIRVIFLVGLMVAVIAVIVFVERGQRRLPVSYAKRVVGRKIYGGQSTHLPLRVNTGGVIPIIFAASVITIPTTIAQMANVPFLQNIAQQFGMGMPLYFLMYIASIIFFTYFYVSIIFNPSDVADNLRKYGGFIPGIRPGKNTADYIDSVLSRLTLVGAFYLALVAAVPEIMISGLKVQTLPFIGPFLDQNLPEWFTMGLNIDFYFGGTSILIVVGVAMDTLQQIEAQLVMRHYDGFMRRSRLKGRRG
ncbi:MAG: preprotein translocase subunit SecY, partial [Candidatus Aminicenantes bacterium]|nr:preprotein translocase subunit SecY [Candidatus Aminicenantes bacterium]